MDKVALKWVRDKIAAEPELFLMEFWEKETSCGTAHCVGGWLRHYYVYERKMNTDAETFLRDIVGLTREQAEQLFYMERKRRNASASMFHMMSFDDLPKARRVEIATAVLDELIASGRVTWLDYWSDVDARWK